MTILNNIQTGLFGFIVECKRAVLVNGQYVPGPTEITHSGHPSLQYSPLSTVEEKGVILGTMYPPHYIQSLGMIVEPIGGHGAIQFIKISTDIFPGHSIQEPVVKVRYGNNTGWQSPTELIFENVTFPFMLPISSGNTNATITVMGKFTFNEQECQDERNVATKYRLTLMGVNLFGNVETYSADVNKGQQWLVDNDFNNPLCAWKSIDKIRFRPLDGTAQNGSINFSVRRWHVAIPFSALTLNPAIIAAEMALQIATSGYDDIGFASVITRPCNEPTSADYTIVKTGLPNLFEYRFSDVQLQWIGFNSGNDVECCDDIDPTVPGWGTGGGGSPPLEPDDPGGIDPSDCCEALWQFVNQLNIRLQEVEIKMTEIADGLNCICQAIQALVLNPVIEVKPADSVNEINLPEIQPIINVAPCEPFITVQALPSPINNINLPPMSPVIEVKPADSVNEINLPEIQPITCGMDLDKYLLHVREDGSENNLLSLMDKIFTFKDRVTDEQKSFADLFLIDDPCNKEFEEQKTIAEILQDHETIVNIENECDIKSTESRSFNRCCPGDDK